MPRIAARAHAKVNLALALSPPEPPGSERPGWHRICTWMHAIDLADDLLVEPLGRGDASTWSAAWAPDAPRPGLVDWPVDCDLAWRALRSLEAHTGRELPTRIVLRKRIPAGAGLGGGSSDAAAALAAINRAWNLALDLDTLRALGAALGSDVPFFLDEAVPPRPAVVGGFGETIERAPRVESGLVLVIPPFPCATAAVYKAFDGLVARGLTERMRATEVRALAASAQPASAALFNDLAPAACAVRPELEVVRARAAAAIGREVHMTGSGSALFALCVPGETGALAQRLGIALPGITVVTGRLL